MRFPHLLERIVSRRKIARDIDAELQFHLDMRTEEYASDGTREARRRALERFGNVDDVVDACRAAKRLPPKNERRESRARGLGQDGRYALRYLFRRPLFALVAIATLTLGIGTSTSIFSMVNSVLLNPMPFEDGDRFAFLWRQVQNGAFRLTAGDHFSYWQERANSFDAMATFFQKELSEDLGTEIRKIPAGVVSPELLSILGIRPVLGRAFIPADTSGEYNAIVLVEGYWKRRFGSDPEVLNTTLRLDEEDYIVVGVIPQRANMFFRERGQKDIWVASAPGQGSILGRLKPGITIEQAEAELTSIEDSHDADGTGPRLKPVVMEPGASTSGDIKVGLWMLLAAVGFLLLIVCANVANMFLTQGLTRGREMAIRSALGGSRGRIMNQLILETFALVLAGAIGGSAMAWGIVKNLGLVLPENLQILSSVHVDTQVLWFVLAVAGLVTIALALAPMGMLMNLDTGEMLNQSNRSGALTPRRALLRKTLVSAEVAIALVLFVGSGLLVKSLSAMSHTDPGFQSDEVLSTTISLPPARYETTESMTEAFDAITASIERLPDVTGVAQGSVPPNFGASSATVGETDQGEVPPAPEGSAADRFRINLISDSYFSVSGTRILQGQPFDAENRTLEGPVIVNEGFARKYWAEGKAVGGRFRAPEATGWNTIVGVAANVTAWGLRDDPTQPQMYWPRSRFPTFSSASFLIRFRGDHLSIIAQVKELVLAYDRTIPPPDINLASAGLSESISRPRFTTLLVSAFAWMAFVLAIMGVYGVIALAARQRTKELGVRIALGAGRNDVLGLMMRQTLTPIVAGVIAGLGISLGLTRFLESLLFEVTATDGTTFVTVTAILVATGLLASYLPARRATTVDPTEALKAE